MRRFAPASSTPIAGYLADVVDGPDGDDWTLRPNQIFAVSLPEPLLEGAEAQQVVDAVGRALFTSYGLRSLSPEHYGLPRRLRRQLVPARQRLSPGARVDLADRRLCRGATLASTATQAARALLRPFADHLRDACLGSVSEILEGDPPHLPRGCVAQAWGVAEVLRVWRELEENEST